MYYETKEVNRTQSSVSQHKHSLQQAWLSSSKIARKAGHWQTAYSAVLQAQQAGSSVSFFQSCKLVKAVGEPLRALQELDHALQRLTIPRNQSQSKNSLTAEETEEQSVTKWKVRDYQFQEVNNMLTSKRQDFFALGGCVIPNVLIITLC